VHSILPTDDRKDLSNEKIQSINAALRTLVKNHQMTYIDIYPLLLDGNNRLNPAYTYDGLHLNGAGYLIWKQAIEKMVEE
jgi:lysophospholipase L1-like esterase